MDNVIAIERTIIEWIGSSDVSGLSGYTLAKLLSRFLTRHAYLSVGSDVSIALWENDKSTLLAFLAKENAPTDLMAMISGMAP